jgi:Ca2+-binding EF-hand superfamily protein
MRKQTTSSLLQRLVPVVGATLALVSVSSFAQTPAPAKPEKTMPPPAASTTAPTASQSNDALFKRIDTDADGALSKTELEKFDPEAAKSFDKYDADKDTKLSLSEFDAMVKGLRGG